MMRALAAAALLACAAPAMAADLQNTQLIAHGKYLVTVGDCAACHTANLAGGRPLATPFGTLISPNLTPDVETGLGGWTDDQFYRAMHTGIAPGDTHLYPGFPYTAYTRVTKDDVLAIRAYLFTIPPVRNPVHSDQLPFPFGIRAVMAVWNTLFFKPGEYKPDASRSAAWNRGAYLVQGLGHCGTCHTPKNFLGADDTNRFVDGEPLQGWFAPALNDGHPAGLADWSTDDIVAYLKTGANPHGLTSSGPMGEVVRISTSHMTDEDLRDIAEYLKSLPQSGNAATEYRPVPAGDPRMQSGYALYAEQCSACHAPNGAGAAHLFPQLAGNPVVQQRGAQSLIRVVLQGAQAVQTDGAPTGPAMPGFWWKLNNQQISDVLTYIRNAWGNAAEPVSAGDVGANRGALGLATP